MNEWDELYISIVLKYVKKNKPTSEGFQKYVDKMSYGSEIEGEDHEGVFRNKKMITANEDDVLILTDFGETILNNIQFKKIKDAVQIFVPIGALMITTVTLVYSIRVGF
jgi:hypothetical protein